jgi:phosphatidylglycerol:prolipoprotein diacylglycerol transferase
MCPTILEFGSLAIRSYGVCLAAAVLLTVWLVDRDARKRGEGGSRIFDLAVIIMVASIAGARFMYVTQHWSEYRTDVLRAFMVWEGGLILLGGLIPGIVVGLLYLRFKGLWHLRDTIALYLPIGIAVTRLGCFLNGCCYGVPTDCPTGMVFPSDGAAGAEFPGVHIHPTQLYSACAAMLIFLMLKSIQRTRPKEGVLFWSFLLIYSLFRFMIDWIRCYEAAAYLSVFTINQWISVLLGLVSAVMLFRIGCLSKR